MAAIIEHTTLGTIATLLAGAAVSMAPIWDMFGLKIMPARQDRAAQQHLIQRTALIR